METETDLLLLSIIADQSFIFVQLFTVAYKKDCLYNRLVTVKLSYETLSLAV